MSRVTIKDVAREAGVSITIASFALNNVKGRVSDEVRERVLECAQKLGYTPNIFARNLRAKNSNTIALVYDESYLQERNASTMQFMAGAVKHASELDKDILVKIFNNKSDWSEASREYLQLWDSQRVEGIIFQCTQLESALLDPLKERNVNFVIVPPLKKIYGYNSVYIDNYELMKEGVRFIHKKGYDEIYFLGLKTSYISEREQGYTDAVRELGIKGKPLYYTAKHRGKAEIWEAIKETVENRTQRIAIACWNDVDAMNVMDVLHSREIGIAKDVGVMGFDDIPASEHAYPPLTTIRQPFEEMAGRAVDLVMENSQGLRGQGIQSIEVPGMIVERESI